MRPPRPKWGERQSEQEEPQSYIHNDSVEPLPWTCLGFWIWLAILIVAIVIVIEYWRS